MPEYWVRVSADGEIEGPLSGPQLGARAASGQLSREALVSIDQQAWHPARRVKGLFSAALAARPAPAPPPPAPIETEISEAAVETMPPPEPESEASQPIPPLLQSPAPMPPLPPTTVRMPRPATPASTSQISYKPPPAPSIRQHRTGTFSFIAFLLLLDTAAAVYLWYMNIIGHPPDPFVFWLLLVASQAIFVGLAATLLIMWLVWVHRAHRDLKVLTSGHYQPSPGKAVGLSFVPVFHVIWAVMMPSKLCGAVNRQLDEAGKPPISRGLVVMCQFLSIFLPLLMPVLYAKSMKTIQGGLNRLSEH